MCPQVHSIFLRAKKPVLASAYLPQLGHSITNFAISIHVSPRLSPSVVASLTTPEGAAFESSLITIGCTDLGPAFHIALTNEIIPGSHHGAVGLQAQRIV